MKIQLSTKAKIEFENDGKVFKAFTVNYKELTRKEQKKLGKSNKEIYELFTKAQSLEKKEESLEIKMNALKEQGNHKQVLEVIKDLEKIRAEQDSNEERFEKLGGIDKFFEASKASFDVQISGDDKEALAKFTEENSDFNVVLDALKQDAKERKGKHS